MPQASTTLRELLGLDLKPAPAKESALILIDCQNTYRTGIMQLTGVEPALEEARKLLVLARGQDIPVIHVRHDAGPGSPYDVRAEIGAISEEVAPQSGEPVITKQYPDAFFQTDLDLQLKALGVKNLILAGFMTHMCIQSTAMGGFYRGYAPAVVASATATRPLLAAGGRVVPAEHLQDSAIAAMRDLYAAIVDGVADI